MRRAALILALSFAAAEVAAQSPLDRRVTVHVKDVALRDALDKVAVLAGIRLSYSGDHLPLDRRVSLDRDTAAVVDVLGDLLKGFPVAPVAASSDHVVLTPRVSADPDTLSRSIAVLERVVVTGSVLGASERPLPIALDIVAGRDIERRNERNLSSVLSGSVPGVWLWEHTPTSLLARYGSIRGASSFGLSFPKIYVDGIEVANPLLLTQITPEVVERIEVIRGPQGAALYGSDAISGVVNIVSRHEGVSPDGNRALLRSNMGFSDSRYATTDQVGVQEHMLAIRGGSGLRSAGFTVGGASSGQYIPRAYSRELRGSADTRLIGARSKLTAHARFHGKNAGVPTSPLLRSFNNDSLASDDEPQELRLYSAGSTFMFVPNNRWTYSVTAGFDGYTLANVSNEQSPTPSVADTALRGANGRAARGTFRANAVRTLVSPSGIGATLTFGAERSDLWDETDVVQVPTGSGTIPLLVRESGRSTSTGLLTQAVVSLKDKAYVTAGLRRERMGQTLAPPQFTTLPLLGAAIVKDFTNVAIKWRAGYGRGVRPGRSTLQLATSDPRRTMRNPSLAPEQQEGFEFGTDIRVGRMLGLHVTRFDQLVSNLIQTVTVVGPSSGPGSKSSWHQLQNVGEITNRGWEMQASFLGGPLSLNSALSLIDSRVQRVAFNYQGDLRPGDRMLAVPSRTLSGTVGWAAGPRGLQLSSTISRASDWVNYDRLRIAQELIRREKDSDDLTGAQLRQFWRPYSGATRLRATGSIHVLRGLTLDVTGENLLGYQLGEPDTITIVPGRTITVGLKARF